MKPLPCPFCRQQPQFKRISKMQAGPEIDHAYWSLGCPGKPIACTGNPMSFGDTKAEATQAWNTRTPVLGESDYRDRARRTFQPLIVDDGGNVRFKANMIVKFLLNKGGYSMNDFSLLAFSPEDRAQFAQLIGYSISGYGELNYVPRDEARIADAIADEMLAERGGPKI